MSWLRRLVDAVTDGSQWILRHSRRGSTSVKKRPRARFERIQSTGRKRSWTSIGTAYATRNTAIFLLSHACVYYGLAVLGFSFLFDNHHIIDSAYLATATFTTIGYGDVYPTSSCRSVGHDSSDFSCAAGRIFFLFLSTYGMIVLGIFLGAMVWAVT